VVVVELADGIRPGGQTVDLRGAGRAVVERMGLLDQMRARSLDQRGIAWVKADGKRRARCRIPRQRLGQRARASARRPDRVLYQATATDTDYRFGARSTELDQVTATLSDGTTVRADLVVGADGPHSAVRRLAFGPE
jgi:2-polyprenyl-6-methoxyphenol hydroxylase-like FAD-dependent oxidoreductase